MELVHEGGESLALSKRPPVEDVIKFFPGEISIDPKFQSTKLGLKLLIFEKEGLKSTLSWLN